MGSLPDEQAKCCHVDALAPAPSSMQSGKGMWSSGIPGLGKETDSGDQFAGDLDVRAAGVRLHKRTTM